MILLLACAADADRVILYGTVWDAPPGEEAAAAAPNTILTVYDELAEEEIDEVVADDAGDFAVKVPAGVGFVLYLRGNTGRTTSFTSTAPMTDFYSGDGYPWVALDPWIASTEAAFEACGIGGAMLVGEVRYPVNGIENPLSWPLLAEATVTVTASDAEARAACYLDAEGVGDPALDATSERGGFGAFGLPEGPAVVEVGVTTDGTIAERYEAWVPQDGVVGLYPASAPVE